MARIVHGMGWICDYFVNSKSSRSAFNGLRRGMESTLCIFQMGLLLRIFVLGAPLLFIHTGRHSQPLRRLLSSPSYSGSSGNC